MIGLVRYLKPESVITGNYSVEYRVTGCGKCIIINDTDSLKSIDALINGDAGISIPIQSKGNIELPFSKSLDLYLPYTAKIITYLS